MVADEGRQEVEGRRPCNHDPVLWLRRSENGMARQVAGRPGLGRQELCAGWFTRVRVRDEGRGVAMDTLIIAALLFAQPHAPIAESNGVQIKFLAVNREFYGIKGGRADIRSRLRVTLSFEYPKAERATEHEQYLLRLTRLQVADDTGLDLSKDAAKGNRVCRSEIV